MENTTLQDIVIRSRSTILDLLEERGYETTPYRKLIGPELVALMSNPFALRMTLKSKTDPSKSAIVEYVFNINKTTVGSGAFVLNLLDTNSPDPNALQDVRPETTEVIVLYTSKNISEEIDSYNTAALNAWVNHKLRIQFFPMARIVNNPMKHVLQPKFKIVPQEQHSQLLKDHYARTKTQLPFIRFHHDMVSRCLGLVPGDIVEITRPSPSAGTYSLYRVCTP
jgi:DNA-directed RNA polymerase subunit H (RpoH/RPB5)